MASFYGEEKSWSWLYLSRRSLGTRVTTALDIESRRAGRWLNFLEHSDPEVIIANGYSDLRRRQNKKLGWWCCQLAPFSVGGEVKTMARSTKKGQNFLEALDIIVTGASLVFYSDWDSSINTVSDDLLLSYCWGCVVSDNVKLTWNDDLYFHDCLMGN